MGFGEIANILRFLILRDWIVGSLWDIGKGYRMIMRHGGSSRERLTHTKKGETIKITQEYEMGIKTGMIATPL